MINLKEIIIPKDVKHLFILVKKLDGTYYGGNIIPKKRWKSDYRTFMKALSDKAETYEVELYCLDESDFSNGNYSLTNLVLNNKSK